MRVRKFWSVLVAVVVIALVGAVAPLPVESRNFALFPADWIHVAPIVLGTPPGSGEEADVYFPAPPHNVRSSRRTAFPVVAMLQGGLVDKMHYEEFGRQLARFGFVVVIPNHFENLPPTFTPAPFPSERMIPAVLAQLKVEEVNPSSPLSGIVDTTRMGISGHSAGGAAGLFAIDETCQPPFCFGPPFLPLPAEVQAGAFYGANLCGIGGELSDPRCIDFGSIPPNPTGELFAIENSSIPVILVQGSRDGVSTPDQGQATFEHSLTNPQDKFLTLKRANHYGICDANNPLGPCNVNLPGPPDPDPIDQTLSQSSSVRRIARSIGKFLRIHLKR